MNEKPGMRFDYRADDEESEASRRDEEDQRLTDESDAHAGPGEAARQEIDERLERDQDERT